MTRNVPIVVIVPLAPLGPVVDAMPPVHLMPLVLVCPCYIAHEYTRSPLGSPCSPLGRSARVPQNCRCPSCVGTSVLATIQSRSCRRRAQRLESVHYHGHNVTEGPVSQQAHHAKLRRLGRPSIMLHAAAATTPNRACPSLKRGGQAPRVLYVSIGNEANEGKSGRHYRSAKQIRLALSPIYVELRQNMTIGSQRRS